MSATLIVDPGLLGATEVTVEGDSYRHLFRARRLQVGDRVRLVDGCGHASWSTVVEVGRRRARLEVGDTAPPNLPTVDLTLAVAALRPERASWLVEKATELGVTAIDFFNCERSPRAYGVSTLERLRRVARAAMEQSGRSRLPQVRGVSPFDEIVTALRKVDSSYVLDFAGDSLLVPPSSRRVIAVVGPEGGFSDAELTRVRDCGARLVSLGSAILRVETAAVAAAALMLTR